MKFVNFFLYLWPIFALLDLDLDPQHCLQVFSLSEFLMLCVKVRTGHRSIVQFVVLAVTGDLSTRFLRTLSCRMLQASDQILQCCGSGRIRNFYSGSGQIRIRNNCTGSGFWQKIYKIFANFSLEMVQFFFKCVTISLENLENLWHA